MVSKPTGVQAALEARKARALKDIEAAIAEHGVEIGKKVARSKYADITKSTWYRWLEEAKVHPIDDAIRAAKKAMQHAGHLIPAPPSPAMIVTQKKEGRKTLDFMSRMETLYSDAELLRKYSVKLDADGTEGVKVPTFFATSIKLRSDLLERWIQAMQLLNDFHHMQGFYAAIVDEIRAESPELAERIMERLSRLNEDKGFTMDARDVLGGS